MKKFKTSVFIMLAFAALSCFARPTHKIKGNFALSDTWTVFPIDHSDSNYNPTAAELTKIPSFIQIGKKKIMPKTVKSIDSTIDFKNIFGRVLVKNSALVYQEINSDKNITATLGFGADWWFTAWFNGRKIADTNLAGNKAWPPSITNYPVDVRLRQGKNLLVIKFSSGSGTSILKAGGPADLKKVPKLRWDIQSRPVLLRRDFAGVKVDYAPKAVKLADTVIALPAKPTVQEKTASKELAAYLQKIVGKKIAVITENDKTSSNVIYIGNTKFAERRNVGVDAMAEEQWINRTIDNNLVLAGGGKRGTLYAVWQFLEHSCGVRWWTPYEESVPANKNLTVAALARQGKPAFSFRMFATHNRMLTPAGKEKLFAPRNRINGELHYSIPFEYGGSMDYGAPGFVHTEGAYLNEMRKRGILKDEWCALKNGKRGGKSNFLRQLCFSNKDMRKAFLQILRSFIANDRKKLANPPLIYNISFNDTSTKCECKTCADIVKKYDCDTGLLLEFLNELAEDIANDYPDVKIATLAYMNTEPLPIGIKPHENVIITFCDTLSNYTKPVPEDDRFGRLLKDWSKAAKEMYIWDYHSNFADKCIPMAFEYTVQRDWQLLKKNSATGIFTEYYPVFEDMHSLRLYLMAKIAEDPFCDQQKWINDFTDGYYGKAAPYIRQYLKYVNDAAKNDTKSHVGTQAPMESCQYITPAFAVEVQKIFNQAAAAVKGDKVLSERVNHARLASDKAAYILYAKIKKGALKESRDAIGARIQKTVEDRSAIVTKDVVQYWKNRYEKGKKRFFRFMSSVTVWDNCDNIDRRTWAQRAWRPRPYAATEVGKLSASTEVKAEGKGSIRLEVTYDDVVAKLKKMPKLDRIGFNYLHGSDFSRNTAYEFKIKCENANHPDIWVAIGPTKWNKILKRGEVTNGWKTVKIPCAGLYKRPCTHTYLRVFATPKAFKKGDKLDIYVDDMKLYR